VRFHNIYRPYGTYDGGREKMPAALCRKVAMAEPGGEIQIWGDGEQTRSFCYVDDCIEGIYRLMQSDYPEALNLGTEDMVTVNTLAEMIIALSGKGDSRCDTSTAPRVSAVEIPTTASCGRCWTGSHRSPSAKDSSPPIAG
jgi:GDP-D-mannose 3', 5'-epimerase